MAIFLVPVAGGQRVVIDKAVIFIGRHPDCDVVLNNSRKVSRKHCCIAQVNNTFVIRDLGSLNGVRINGRRIKRLKTLKLGDELTIGDTKYQFLAEGQKNRPAPLQLPDEEPLDIDQLPVSQAQPPQPKFSPNVPVDISQEYPVPIPDDDGFYDDEADDVILIDDDDDDDSFVQDDDVILLDSSDDL